MNERKQYTPSEWVDSRIDIRPSPIGGLGMFACAPFSEGEPVVIWGGTVFTRAEIDAGGADPNSTVPIDERLYLGSPAGSYDRDQDDRGDYINHSCDPNIWMRDEVTLIARRDIVPGEELTTDYALWKDDEQSVAAWSCRCGSPLCRDRITGRDWRRADLQQRYQGHFSPFINERIKQLKSALT